ncbi:MAG TPA: hypothetical protein PKW95_06315 [bacterium]|nr:hypothetical protein [bacterium]
MANFVPYIRKQKSRRGASSAALEDRNTYAVEVEDDEEKDIVIARPVKGMATRVKRNINANRELLWKIKPFPQWYCGFTGDSYIELNIKLRRKVKLHLGFRFGEDSFFDHTVEKIHFADPDNEDGLQRFDFAKKMTYLEAQRYFNRNPTKYRVQKKTLARMGDFMKEYFQFSGHVSLDDLNNQKTGLLMQFNDTEWPSDNPNRFDFDDISITNLGEETLRLHGIKIVLNEAEIYTAFFPSERTLGNGESVRYNDAIRSSRLKLSGYGVDHMNGAIRFAAERLGQNFPPQYQAIWDYDEDTGLYIHRPQRWCSEFVSWLFRETTNQRNFFKRTVQEIADKFREICGFISAKNTLYKDLGNIIKPGDYCGYYHVKGGDTKSHSMIFIRWTDGFNPMRKVNKMTTISGVSSGIKVIDNYEVGVEERPHKDRDRYIYWNNNYNYREFNGFGPTDKL